jgi:serine phosphatase RsbU (regulator of sigma subunit)
MSMIGNDLLNEAVHLQGLRDPAAVLQYMHEHLQDRLQQEEGTSVKDGMDVALCFLDHERGVLRFAGARSPMVYVRQGALHELKGTRLSVGGKGDGPFQAEEVPLEAGMACYLFSDGYQDQFGGPEGRKFMKKRLLERMAEWHARPMREQGEAFRQELADWMGESQQIDDILLLGFRATA